jgi:hypothetical protein
MSYQQINKKVNFQTNSIKQGTFNAGSLAGGVSSFNNAKFSNELIEAYVLTNKNASAKGYIGGCFDGRYIYLVPYYNGSFHGLFIRYDTTLSYTDNNSYEIFDLASINVLYVGYHSCCFDGRYVYISPYWTNTSTHGNFIRYDTWGSFTTSGNYTAFNLTTLTGLTGYADFMGFGTSCFDGRYIYLVTNSNASVRTGYIIRYDTGGAGFTNAASYASFNLASISANYVGYYGATILNNYMYLTPFINPTTQHGNIIRYDLTKTFTSSDSYEVYNLADIDSTYTGFIGNISDGRYIYFTQYSNLSAYRGLIIRYDSTQPFNVSTSWQTLDISAINANVVGLGGELIFDGRYIILASPISNGSAQGTITRYDTTKPFVASSIEIIDLNALNTAYRGHSGAIFDGKYMYCIPRFSALSTPSEYFLRLRVKL